MSVSPSATADSLVYIIDSSSSIRAIRPDGTEEWRYRLADDLKDASGIIPDLTIDSLTALSGGSLYVLATIIAGSRNGTIELCGLNANHIVWHREIAAAVGTGPVAVDSQNIYLAAADGALYAFSRGDGGDRWKVQLANGPLGMPLSGVDGTIYVTGPGHNLHAVTPDGVQKWKAATGE